MSLLRSLLLTGLALAILSCGSAASPEADARESGRDTAQAAAGPYMPSFPIPVFAGIPWGSTSEEVHSRLAETGFRRESSRAGKVSISSIEMDGLTERYAGRLEQWGATLEARYDSVGGLVAVRLQLPTSGLGHTETDSATVRYRRVRHTLLQQWGASPYADYETHRIPVMQGSGRQPEFPGDSWNCPMRDDSRCTKKPFFFRKWKNENGEIYLHLRLEKNVAAGSSVIHIDYASPFALHAAHEMSLDRQKQWRAEAAQRRLREQQELWKREAEIQTPVRGL